MGCRGQQKDMVAAVAQQFPQLVALALVGLDSSRHPVSLGHDHQVPVYLSLTIRLCPGGRPLVIFEEGRNGLSRTD